MAKARQIHQRKKHAIDQNPILRKIYVQCFLNMFFILLLRVKGETNKAHILVKITLLAWSNDERTPFRLT